MGHRLEICILNSIGKNLAAIFNNVEKYLFGPAYGVLGISFLRSIYGFTSLALLVSSYANRYLFVGPNSVFVGDEQLLSKFRVEEAWSFYSWMSSSLVFDLFYHASMVFALLTCLGIFGKLSLFLNYVSTWSFLMAAPALADGGDNFMFIAGIMLMFTRCYNRVTVAPSLARLVRVPVK